MGTGSGSHGKVAGVNRGLEQQGTQACAQSLNAAQGG